MRRKIAISNLLFKRFKRFTNTWDVRLNTLVVCTFVNLNRLSEHVKNWKIKNRSLHWFVLSELNKTMGSVCGRKMAENR